MLIAGIRGLFSLHAVLIDNMSPSEARKSSAVIIKQHWKHLLWLMFLTAIFLTLLNIGFRTLLTLLYSGLEAKMNTFMTGG